MELNAKSITFWGWRANTDLIQRKLQCMSFSYSKSQVENGIVYSMEGGSGNKVKAATKTNFFASTRLMSEF